MPPTSADKPNFNHIARPYRWLEYLTLGPFLERCRQHYLPNLLQQNNALILGDGDGRFTAKLLTQNPTIQADAVDTSATMLRLLRHRCEATAPNAATRLRTHQTSALTFPLEPPKQNYDLVVTHFFLDCLTQPDLEALIARVTPTLAPGALWLISDFHIPAGPMRLPARALIRSLYLVFRILTGLRTTHLPDHATPLTKAGLTRKAHHHRLAGLLTAELWQTPNQKTWPHQPAQEPALISPPKHPPRIFPHQTSEAHTIPHAAPPPSRRCHPPRPARHASPNQHRH